MSTFPVIQYVITVNLSFYIFESFCFPRYKSTQLTHNISSRIPRKCEWVFRKQVTLYLMGFTTITNSPCRGLSRLAKASKDSMKLSNIPTQPLNVRTLFRNASSLCCDICAIYSVVLERTNNNNSNKWFGLLLDDCARCEQIACLPYCAHTRGKSVFGNDYTQINDVKWATA